MNTLSPRPAHAARLTTDHPPDSHAFDARPTPIERLQLRLGLWLIRRATAPRHSPDRWAEHLRLQRIDAERERQLAQAHFSTHRMR